MDERSWRLLLSFIIGCLAAFASCLLAVMAVVAWREMLLLPKELFIFIGIAIGTAFFVIDLVVEGEN